MKNLNFTHYTANKNGQSRLASLKMQKNGRLLASGEKKLTKIAKDLRDKWKRMLKLVLKLSKRTKIAQISGEKISKMSQK